MLRDFAKANPLLVIKGGLLDGKALDAAEVSKLADLESRDVLLAKMAGAMLATLTKAAIVLNALPSQVVRLAAALVEKRTEEQGAPDSTEGDSAPESAAREAGTPDASSDEVPTEAAPAVEPTTDAAPAAEALADAAPASEVASIAEETAEQA